MLFGSCCFLKQNAYQNMIGKSIKINGFQQSLIVNFEVEQSFYHNEKCIQEVSYIFPNDFKICIYDITFVVGDEIIKPVIKSKREAEKIYDEAVKAGRTAVFGTNIGHGMTKINIGNVQPNIECKVILKMVFTGQMTSQKSFFIKFPIDVYNSSGSCGCLGIGNNSDFYFHLQTNKEEVSKVTSNVKNSNFDELTNLFSIENTLENDKNENSIIATFQMKQDIDNLCLISPKNSDEFESCALLISPNFPDVNSFVSKEFIFLIDCSGSMHGTSIKKASECLSFFIKSLPSNCYFNVIRFGTNYVKLFDDSVLYDDKTLKEAINLADHLHADLRSTNIFSPLNDIFSKEALHGQRQVFIMTDGEVSSTETVLELVSKNSNKNRCYTIGIGRGCDAGLVEGIAAASGGTSYFVQEGDSIAEKVIPQLQSSLQSSFNSIEIFIEGESNDAFEISPFPIPSISMKSSSFVYIRHKKQNGKSFDDGILITGNYDGDSVEIPILDFESLVNVDEDKYGRSFGKNIGKAILPLFAFSIIQNFEKRRNIQSNEEIEKIVKLSIESGVLCKYTGYVGFTEVIVKPIEESCEEIVESVSGRKHRRKRGTANSNTEDIAKPIENNCDQIVKSVSGSEHKMIGSTGNSNTENIAKPIEESCEEIVESVSGRKHRRKRGTANSNTEDIAKPIENNCDQIVESVSGNEHKMIGSTGNSNTENIAKPIEEGCEGICESVSGRKHRRKRGTADSNTDVVIIDGLCHKRRRKPENENGNDDDIKRIKPETIQEDVEKNSRNDKEKQEITNEEEFVHERRRTEKFDLMKLIGFQKAGGYWDDLNAVKEITGIKINKIDEINLDDKNIENTCIGTMIAIAAIRVKSPDLKNSWIMIESKALSWLKMTLPDVDIDQIISNIEHYITQNN